MLERSVQIVPMGKYIPEVEQTICKTGSLKIVKYHQRPVQSEIVSEKIASKISDFAESFRSDVKGRGHGKVSSKEEAVRMLFG